MPDTSGKSDPDTGAPSADLYEVVDSVKEYVRQETLEPLRGWGRYVGFGFSGSVIFAVGVVVSLLGLLRLLQTEVDAFDGPNTSILAYLITLGAGAVVIGVVAWQVKRRTSLQGEENGR